MEQQILKINTSQKDFFQSGATRDVSFRKKTLQKLLIAIQENEKEICEALFKDFKKPEFESVVTETFIVINELKSVLKNLTRWAKPKSVSPTLLNFPSSDAIYYQPYGTVLIIAPFNYPFQLALLPLIGAVAAGNTAVLKPSEHTPHVSALIKKIVSQVFIPQHVSLIEGGVACSQELLKNTWDYIFFTGSVAVGKIVAKAAAEYLTPITLELGGKSPCIVDDTAKIPLAARRIVFGKFVNAGQTCIAPDYILVQKNVKQKLVDALIAEIERFYGKNPKDSPDLARIINYKNWQRLCGYLQGQKLAYGGQSDAETLYLSPTLVDEPPMDSAVMQEEIFGPILPVLSYENREDIKKVISKNPNPLSLYLFSENKKFSEKIIREFSFGGGTVNDTLVHFANPRLPFGGIGNSGMGNYSGKFSFETFSHKKSVVKRGTWIDLKIRYAPYSGKIKRLKQLLKWV